VPVLFIISYYCQHCQLCVNIILLLILFTFHSFCPSNSYVLRFRSVDTYGDKKTLKVNAERVLGISAISKVYEAELMMSPAIGTFIIRALNTKLTCIM
jgi:hypothetical protein